MKKALGLGLSLFILSNQSLADFTFGVDYINLEKEVKTKNTLFDANVNAVAAVAGYSFHYSDNITITPEISYGVGISEDEDNSVGGGCSLCDIIYRADVELDSVVRISTKFSYELNSDFKLFTTPAFSFTDLSSNLSGLTVSDDSDFGVDFGGEYNIGKHWSAQASYGLYQYSELWNFGIRYTF
ncbi:outer membrane beta-barrel protein [Paraglaciecola sp. MB-3u-78]|uniref:outer membrane beta-barrel protein n=1 Tax=Paraglaciecola sp. MB-3u-78 TaxID=2058332 RepID=UPI000C34AE91|nr:outer membrane beta-barrel protein [Paraglaciecola sp. MB-3u-78]PKG97726.1 hypothetical protein CXF95_14825 [Paraglaciecola sp. MB-3u-78]